MRVYQQVVLSAGNMTGDLATTSWQLNQSYSSSASCVVSGGSSPSGTLTMLGSVDNTNFTPLKVAGADMTLTVTDNGTYLFDVTQTSVQYLKVTYTFTSGTGNLTVTAFQKGY